MRTDLSSASRAKAFLWLCFNYLESPVMDSEDDYDSDVIVNPFGDPRKDGKPSFVHLTAEEAASENVDPEDELRLAEKLIEHRSNLLQGLQSKEKVSSTSGSVIGDIDDTPGLGGEEISGVSKGKRKRENAPTVKNPRTTTTERKPATDKMPKGRKQKPKLDDNPPDDGEGSTSAGRMSSLTSFSEAKFSTPLLALGGNGQRVMSVQNQYPLHQLLVRSSSHHQYPADADITSNHRYTPYQREYTTLRQSSDIYQAARARRPVPPRSFLQRTFGVVLLGDEYLPLHQTLGSR